MGGERFERFDVRRRRSSPMSTERDELVTDIMQHPWLVAGEFTGACPSCPDLTIEGGYNSPSHASHIADSILAAGYRKLRVVTKPEELDKLHMVVVRTEAGTIANIVGGRAYCFGYEQSAPVGALALPVTILWERANV